MRTTINIDDHLFEEASRLTGVKGKAALVRTALETLISLTSARRLAALGGSQPQLEVAERRRLRSRRRGRPRE